MRTTLLLASCLVVAFTVDSQARETFKDRTVAVDYADLDLSNDADVKILRQRVDKAAKTACSTPYDKGIVLGTSRDTHRCLVWAKEQAMASIDTKQLASRTTAIRADRQTAEAVMQSTNKTEPNRAQRSVKLSWRNMDLTQSNNLKALHARINQSAETVCNSPADQGAGVAGNRDKAACMAEAKQAAYASLGGAERFAALDRPGQATQTAATTEKKESLWDWIVTILK